MSLSRRSAFKVPGSSLKSSLNIEYALQCQHGKISGQAMKMEGVKESVNNVTSTYKLKYCPLAR